jgi:transcriptional regulator of nitric oxide reductase
MPTDVRSACTLHDSGKGGFSRTNLTTPRSPVIIRATRESVLKKIVALGLMLATAGAATAADRIFTNPVTDAHVKKLFPSAVAFSQLAGTPLHVTAYAADPQKTPAADPLGFVFWTTDLVPNEHGYHGPIHILVGMDMSGVLTGVIVDYDSEPYGYFSVEPKEFAEQFTNKSIRDPFRVGGDVDAVSRASLSINSAARAIRDSSRIMARALLTPDAVKR